jgi:Zinc finger, C2H2 type
MQQHWRICVISWPSLKVKLQRLTDEELLLVCEAPEHQGECQQRCESCTTSDFLESNVKCSLLFCSPGELQQHSKVHFEPVRISCEHCGASFEERLDLQEHLQQHTQMKVHASGTVNSPSIRELPNNVFKETVSISLPQQQTFFRNYICQMCGKDFILLDKFNYHVAKHKTSTPGIFKCLHWKCLHLMFHNAVELREHNRGIHDYFKITHYNDRLFLCTRCLFTYKSAKDLLEHESKMHSLCPFKCVCCGEGFHDELFYVEHLDRHKTEKPGILKCLFAGCQGTFSLPQDVTLHTMEHRALCDIPDCLFISTSEPDLRKHKTIVHSIQPYRCYLCYKILRNDSNYRQHLKEHNTENEGVFKCLVGQCKETFSVPSDLIVHTQQRICRSYLHKCDVPDCTFTSRMKGLLQVHKKNVHSIWLYNCQVCGKGFDRLTDQKRHMKSHDTVEMVINDFWLKLSGGNQTFKSSNALKENASRHVDFSMPVRNSLACDFTDCYYAFKSHQELENHKIKMHNLELRACRFCGEEFRKLWDLLQHIKSQHDSQQIAEDFNHTAQDPKITEAQYVLVCKNENEEEVDLSLG